MIFGKAAVVLVAFIIVMWLVGRLLRDRRR
jgi:hypothetical protein